MQIDISLRVGVGAVAESNFAFIIRKTMKFQTYMLSVAHDIYSKIQNRKLKKTRIFIRLIAPPIVCYEIII